MKASLEPSWSRTQRSSFAASEIATPAPLIANGLIYVTNGYRGIQPIHAIRPGASGAISLKDNRTSNESIAWSHKRGGPYTPTPVIYGDQLYIVNNQGVLSAYNAKNGERIYQERVGDGGSYSASMVAGDGKVYLFSENGDVYGNARAQQVRRACGMRVAACLVQGAFQRKSRSCTRDTTTRFFVVWEPVLDTDVRPPRGAGHAPWGRPPRHAGLGSEDAGVRGFQAHAGLSAEWGDELPAPLFLGGPVVTVQDAAVQALQARPSTLRQ